MADEGWKKPIFIVKWMTKYFDSLMEKLDAIQNMFGTSGDADVSSADIRLGKKAYNGTTLVTGTMPENVTVAETLAAGEAYVIPQGYHDGTGKVTADSLASQTDGTATAAQILSGKTAYVDGVKVTGSMTNNGAKTASLAAGASYIIPAGYHDGTGKVTANSLESQTDGTATAAQILSGKTAYVDGKKVTGSMGNKAGTTVEASAVTQDDTNTYFNVPAGFYDANSKVYTPNSNLGGFKIPFYDMYGSDIRGNSNTLFDVSKFKTLTIGEATRTGNACGTMRIFGGNNLEDTPTTNQNAQLSYYIANETLLKVLSANETNIVIDISNYDYIDMGFTTRDVNNNSGAHCGWFLKNIEFN